MKENLKIATDFAQSIKKIKGVLQIVLFGSVSRGEDKAASDIDIGIVFDNVNKFDLTKEVIKHKHEKIQLTFIHLKDLYRETELTGALSGEGLLLYGRPVNILAERMGLKPRILVCYSLRSLLQTEKVKLGRALYGSVSASKSQGKEYKTETKGLVAEQGIDKIGNGILLVDRGKSAKIVSLLKRFKAEVRELVVWTY